MRGTLPVWILCLATSVAVSCSEAQVMGPGGTGPGGVDPARPGAGPAGPGGGSPAPTGPGAPGTGVSLPEPTKNPAAPDAATTQCAAEAHKAEIVPLDLMLLVDTSSSMTGSAGMRTKWQTAQAALKSFVSDPKSAGLSMGLQFFPQQKLCMTDGDCLAGAMNMDRFCTRKQVCAGPGGPAPNAQSCGPQPFVIIGPPTVARCSAGTTCLPLGSCSESGAPCTNAGQACPMGGGMCEVPQKTCTFGGGAECSEARYEMPEVTVQPLPMGAVALNRALDRKTPTGGTPLGPAVRGVLAHLRSRLMADPGRKVALILASDGLPGGCTRNDIPSIAADMASAFTGPPSIPTYVIGVFGQNEVMSARPQMDMLAMSGGTNQAFVLTATDDLNMRLLAALDQIRGAALACEYRIPAMPSGKLDFGKVNVRATGPGGPENVPYVERMDRCDATRGGWYYDVHPSMGTPNRILVCPATCNRFKSAQGSQVELVFGCATQNID